jgi:pimeloyl-ACP methyl ester carboxylesterase
VALPRRAAHGTAVSNEVGDGAIDRLEIDANGFTFTARAAGPHDGRQVLLLHGFPQTSWCWRAQLTALAGAGYRAVAPDQRGYSPRARPAQIIDYALGWLVSDILAMADALEMETFDLVGHDWGGLLAWLVGTFYTDRMRSLTVASTPHPVALGHALRGGDAGQMEQIDPTNFLRIPAVPEKLLLGSDGSGDGLRTVLVDSGLPEEDARAYTEVLTQPGAMTAALNWFRAMSVKDLIDLAPVTIPTLYVWSSGDPALSRAAAEMTEVCVSGPYRFEVLDGVNHWIPETAPAELSSLLLQHLAAT